MKSLMKDSDRKMIAQITSMILGVIVAIAFFGGLIGFSLGTLGLPLALLSAVLFFALYFSMTEFKVTLMNITFFVIVLAGLAYLGSVEIVNNVVNSNVVPIIQGIIGAGIIGTLFSLANAKFGRGK